MTNYVEKSKNTTRKDNKDWLVDSGASSHITYDKKDMTYVEKVEINVTVVNGKKMKCKLKGLVNMNM